MPALGPSRKKRSTTSSEIRSQTLSGCPSDTDSLVNKYDLRNTLAFPSAGWWRRPWTEAPRRRQPLAFLQRFRRGSRLGADPNAPPQGQPCPVGSHQPRTGTVPTPPFAARYFVRASAARVGTSGGGVGGRVVGERAYQIDDGAARLEV